MTNLEDDGHLKRIDAWLKAAAEGLAKLKSGELPFMEGEVDKKEDQIRRVEERIRRLNEFRNIHVEALALLSRHWFES